MLKKSILLEINEVLSAAIELVEIDYDSSAVHSRKILESLLKIIYQNEKYELPLGPDGHTSIDLMLKDLIKRKLITQFLYEQATLVRKNGNLAAHHSDSKIRNSDTKESIRSVAIICEWFLQKYNSTNNSLYYLAIQHAPINKNKINDVSTMNNIKLFEEFIKLSVFKNNLRVFDTLENSMVNST
jgi:hypothetical protein